MVSHASQEHANMLTLKSIQNTYKYIKREKGKLVVSQKRVTCIYDKRHMRCHRIWLNLNSKFQPDKAKRKNNPNLEN